VSEKIQKIVKTKKIKTRTKKTVIKGLLKLKEKNTKTDDQATMDPHLI